MKTVPYNRHEIFLAALSDSSITVPTPYSREELYLAKIAGEDVTIPTAPYNRFETYLAKLAGEDVTVPSPVSRLEYLLYNACGNDCDVPVPANREEVFWRRYIGYESDGSDITITGSASEKAKSAVITITPTLSGKTSATITRTGKNMYDPTLFVDRSRGGITSAVQEDGSILLTGTVSSASRYSSASPNVTLPNGTYTLSAPPYGVVGKKYVSGEDVTITNSRGVFTIENFKMYFYVDLKKGQVVDAYEHIQIEHASGATAYEPYNGDKKTINLTGAGTVYGGTLDVVSGLLTVTHAYIDSYNNEDLPGEWISSEDTYVPGTKPTVGAHVVYKMDEEDYEVYQLQAKDVEMLEGINNIWSNVGPVSVSYIPDI